MVSDDNVYGRKDEQDEQIITGCNRAIERLLAMAELHGAFTETMESIVIKQLHCIEAAENRIQNRKVVPTLCVGEGR